MPSRAPRVAAKAGASPSPIPVATAIAAAKSQTSGPKLTFISRGNGLIGLIDSVTRSSQWEKKSPAAPPPKASSTLSVSNCRTSRQRPAPSAKRTAISRRRSPARANSSPARFAQASDSTSPTGPDAPARPSASAVRSHGRLRHVARSLQSVRLRLGSSGSIQSRIVHGTVHGRWDGSVNC